MFVLVILNKGFKRRFISTGLFSFVLAQVTRIFFFNRVETFVGFWKREFLGTFVRNHICFRPVAHKD